MKRIKSICLTALLGISIGAQAQNTPVEQMENLGRGLVAVPSSSTGVLLSWRLLGTDDDERTTFDVIRDDEVIKADLAYVTNYSDTQGKSGNVYKVVTKVDGVAVDTTDAVSPWTNPFYRLQLQRPAAGSDYDYSPGDCSVGDVDGDGEYEIIVKWDPSNS